MDIAALRNLPADERLVKVKERLDVLRGEVGALEQLRREAIDELVRHGMTYHRIAARAGLSMQRIGQLAQSDAYRAARIRRANTVAAGQRRQPQRRREQQATQP